MNFAVIGENIQNSLSPRMHQWIYNSLGLGCKYKAIDISLNRVDSIVNKLRKQILNGVNITIPFKIDFISYLDEIDPLAFKIGAVNCIHSYNGILTGYNTDYYGFKKLVSYNNIDFNNKEILVLGAGGASRAICVYLANNKKKFSVLNRNYNNALSLIQETNCEEYGEVISGSIPNLSFDVIINSLPASVNILEILKFLGYNFKLLDYYIDINYHIDEQIHNRIKAQSAIYGLSMLIYQGIRSNEIWMQENLEQKIDYSKLYNFLLES
tara:strand:- start:348 stop:1151 length:804 start_codon:yes stop_codon:yes gene_type:complete